MTSGSNWTWLTDHWRLKALSALLAVILFGTVAFAQNPITVKTLHVRITSYQITDPSLVLIKYPTHVDVQVVGLADAINPLTPDDIVAAMDLSKVAAPTGAPPTIQVAVNVRTVASGVTLQQSSIPVFVTVDSVTTEPLQIQVQAQPQPGVTMDKVDVARHGTTDSVSTVNVTGATSLLNGLKAYVDLGPIEGTTEFPDAPIKYQDETGKAVKWPAPTIPLGSSDLSSVDVYVTAHQTQQQRTVAAAPSITGQPACGYAVGGISVAPQYVTLTGDVASLSGAGDSIALNAIDITGATGTIRSSQKLLAPNGTTVSPGTVTVTITVRQVASCTPVSPTPAPSPTPT